MEEKKEDPSETQFREIDSWVVVDSFFKKHDITGQQIQSFNDFVDNLIPKIIDDCDQIDILDPKGIRHLFKLRSLPNGLQAPSFTEMNAVVNKVYPNTARLRNLTYAGELHARVEYNVVRPGKLQKIIVPDSSRKRIIGRIPIMVMSKRCLLAELKSEKEFEAVRECSIDPGGYFVINGKERVVLTQERAANNTVFVFPGYTSSKTILDCEIRSVNEDSCASANAFWVQLDQEKVIGKRPNVEKDMTMGSMKQFVLKALFPGLKHSVHIHVLYQAIGFKSQGEVYDSIVEFSCRRDLSNRELDTIECFKPILFNCFQVWKNISPADAKGEMGNLYSGSRTDYDVDGELNYEVVKQKKANEQRKFVENLLLKRFLPHVGTGPESFRKKGLFLSYMIWKLLMVFTKQMPHDDRDHIQNKRYYSSGPLLGQIFHRHQMEINLKFQLTNTEDPIDITKAMYPAFVTQRIAHCLYTGNWGIPGQMQCNNTRFYSNVTQELNRFSRNSHIATLRRLHSAEDKLQLMTKPRQLHNTYFGLICPFETPEGCPIGLVKNLALLAQITVSYHVKPIIAFFMEQTNLVTPLELGPGVKTTTDRYGATKVFVNGQWLGYTKRPEELVYKFREARRCGQISSYISICWEQVDMTIVVTADAGRLCRPLLVARNNKLALKPSHIKKMKAGKLKWDHLIRYGLVEIIDVRESESILIAMDLKILKEDSTKHYTHMEIHPALMMGICAFTVPFSQHTQSPRVVYQSGIAKQAMGLYATNFMSRMDTTAHFLHYAHRPIVETKGMKYFKFNEIPAGAVCTVAMACYSGYNMEDAIILNRSAVQRGLFRSTMFRTYQETAKQYWENQKTKSEVFTYPPPATTKGIRISCGGTHIQSVMKLYTNIGSDGIPVPGEKFGHTELLNFKLRNHLLGGQINEMLEEQAIIGKVRPLPEDEMRTDCARLSRKDTQGLNVIQSKYTHRDKTLFVKKPQTSCIDDSLITYNHAGELLVKVRTRTQLTPQVGDKFASLHGQKGVIGMDFHEVDLPVTKDGIVPDLIMNPHGVPSRMTIGQLQECIHGKAAALSGKIMDGTPFQKRTLISNIFAILEQYGYCRNGSEVMYDGRTGHKIRTPIFIGPTYYQRLKHLVDDKIHSRARGYMDVLTQQPTKGFSRDGGLRFGEMERDCLISHGSGLFLIERMMDVSDGRRYVICGDCGLITSNNPVFHIYHETGKYNKCSSCSRPTNDNINPYPLFTVNLPYATKLLFQELMSMNVIPRIIPASFPEDETPVFLPEDGNSSNETLLAIAAATAPESLFDKRQMERCKLIPMDMTDMMEISDDDFASPVQIKEYNPEFYDEETDEED